MLTGARSPLREAHASPRLTEGSRLSPCLQTLLQSPQEPPLLVRGRGRSLGGHRWSRGKGGRTSHLSPRALLTTGGVPAPHPGSPGGTGVSCGGPGDVGGSQPSRGPLISGALEHLCFPRRGRGGLV